MNTFAKKMENFGNMVVTENGGLAHSLTGYKVYDMFGIGAAYRKRSDEDCIFLFKKAWDENPELALKCLFYLRDVRGGQGERRFFRVVLNWLAKNEAAAVKANLVNIPEYGRYDDLFVLFDTPVENDMIKFIREQLALDLECQTPSLLAKWMPSENASSSKTKALARKFRNLFGMNAKMYRQMLSTIRTKINLVETLMSENRWGEIEFDKIPSKAGLKYRNAFARRDIIAKKYEAFIQDKDTKANAATLFPYEIVAEAVKGGNGWFSYNFEEMSDIDRAALEKYWNNLPDYIGNNEANMMCVIDTSGSMTGREAAAPINVAIALGMYCAERLNGPFKNHFITFSSRPRYMAIEGIDFVDKVRRIYKQNLCENTNLEATFDLIYNTAMNKNVRKEDIPETVVVISDMEVDAATTQRGNVRKGIKTMMEAQREKWNKAGLKMPELIYWNIESRNKNIFLDDGPSVTYVSGASPVIFKSVLAGKKGIDLMLEILNGERYKAIKII